MSKSIEVKSQELSDVDREIRKIIRANWHTLSFSGKVVELGYVCSNALTNDDGGENYYRPLPEDKNAQEYFGFLEDSCTAIAKIEFPGRAESVKAKMIHVAPRIGDDVRVQACVRKTGNIRYRIVPEILA